MFEVGDSFILKNVIGKHLHVVVAESSPNEGGLIMLVYLTSAKNNQDLTTVVRFGEHPFVTKKDEISWIKYQSIRIGNRSDIKQEIFEFTGKINPDLLIRIQEGIQKSKFVSKEHKRLYYEWHTDRLLRESKS